MRIRGRTSLLSPRGKVITDQPIEWPDLKATRAPGLRQASQRSPLNNLYRMWYKRHIKKSRTNSAPFHHAGMLLQRLFLNEQTNVGFAGKFEEGRRTAVLKAIDEVGMFEAEQFDGHLAGNEFDFGFLAQFAQVRNGRHAIVGDGLLHQGRCHVFIAGDERLDGIGHVPVDALEPFWTKGHFHRHAGVAKGAHFKERQILADELEDVEGEENLGFITQCSRRRGQDERWVSPVLRALCGDDGHFFGIHALSPVSLKKQRHMFFFRNSWRRLGFFYYFFFMKKVNSPPASAVDSSSLPVCLAKAAKSLTEPGSVDRIFSTCPLATSARAFLARRMGRGQFRPRASSSLSKFMLFSLH